MQYLITTKNKEPFLTEWFTSENLFSEENEMVVYDLWRNKYTNDGNNWKPIIQDHL